MDQARKLLALISSADSFTKALKAIEARMARAGWQFGGNVHICSVNDSA